MEYSEVLDLAQSIQALANKYEITTNTVMHVIATQVDTLEELRNLDYKDLDAIVQEGLAELGR